MQVELGLILYVQEELDNIRTALVDTEVAYLLAVERDLRRASTRLVQWIDAFLAPEEDD